MVCLQNEQTVDIVCRELGDETAKKETNINVSNKKSIDNIFNEVASRFDYHPDEIEILYHTDMKTIALNDHRKKDLDCLGINCTAKDFLEVQRRENSTFIVNDGSEDELLLGASASPTTRDRHQDSDNYPSVPIDDFYKYISPSSNTNEQMNDVDDENAQVNRKCRRSENSESRNYVGLVNQAMTCYLNSLLQALYMTPEFRNALYNWEFDGQNETRSIPYQLQKLFLNLQTSTKSAVETTDLTTSFGWQGSDAWQQHDIQELCRVMFDALEQKFKDTSQANLINDLYEGKMLDYVKCLECSTEKSREDTFLDIPLPVKPFCSAIAYNSVEEALRAFVQPETLDGNNQYHCETCNKKCDAHKGLKFIKFPYLLTLHLKRFDFDYNTMHRIKLNDKVVFPEILNLNSFVSNADRNQMEVVEERESVKCDDCSTADSGSADDESCQGTDGSSTVNGQDDNCADSDEGIDVSSGHNHSGNENKGPYIYELFSIMIHSGSASGGHYYAYIKDFDKNLWFCFNDSSVTEITEDDIRKTYGGGPQKGYYSGAYSTSTNAYMLMYRQIDKERNCRAMTTDEFPAYIKKLLQDIRRKEEEDRRNREKENDMVKLNVHYRNPMKNVLQTMKISIYNDLTLAEMTQYVHQRLKIRDFVQVEDCRMVLYNRTHDCIDCSFAHDDMTLCDIIENLKSDGVVNYLDWMLEMRKPDEFWQCFKRGGINVRAYFTNLQSDEINEPITIRVDVDDKVIDVKRKIEPYLQHCVLDRLGIALQVKCNEFITWPNDKDLVNLDPDIDDYKLFVYSRVNDEDVETTNLKLQKFIEKYAYVMNLEVVLPEADVGTLEALSIPPLDCNQNSDKLDRCSPNLRTSPLPSSGDQSNSEDSSLSESDRTLVGNQPDDCVGLLSSSSNSPADQHMAFPTDTAEENYQFDINFEEMGPWHDVQIPRQVVEDEVQSENDFFKVTSVVRVNIDGNPSSVQCCKLLVDKRMTLECLKKHLEMVVRVPMEYFKLFKQHGGNADDELTCGTHVLMSSVKDGERLIIKLGRVLKKGDLCCKVYHLKPDFSECFLYEHIIAKGQTVSVVKKEILMQVKKQFMLDIPLNKCRLREKHWKKPRLVYLDEQKFTSDIIPTSSFELFLQELSEPETVHSSDQTILFIRQWSPSTLTLHPICEIVLETYDVEELLKNMSMKSNIPVENIELVQVKTYFPFDMHVLEIQQLEWNLISNVAQSKLNKWPINVENGTMFYYRDNRESLKELSSEEKNEINQRENSRLGKTNSKSYYSYDFSSFSPISPRRERALKIYLDSPSKPEDKYPD